ncbi:NUMOD1 domain-containing DNA-binding protein [Liquorilactobacillus hordei]|uniref:Uncharacterized protein n=1 Tax=Liquorilactobacillus hordei DSM 19519 TaxID=1423759 RepID=A0A0R1MQK2_9LACO|nr:NUMOD1 domain-containing DNA-binding protein [Liquorilactobacillus hordei]KRL08020.1 hypothetical protein FC92_GL001093 [Liquorilactobacillus hordei DSM 19519]QYH51033.1 hypothetical protein G6O70_00270 [Liquorilactobacillus hordei DSM 19519]
MANLFGDDFYKFLSNLDYEVPNWANVLSNTDPRIIYMQKYVQRKENELEELRIYKEIKDVYFEKQKGNKVKLMISQKLGISMNHVNKAFSNLSKTYVYHCDSNKLIIYRSKNQVSNKMNIERREVNKYLNSFEAYNGYLIFDILGWYEFKEDKHYE